MEIEEEVRDFAARFARLVINRAFRGDDVLGTASTALSGADPRRTGGSGGGADVSAGAAGTGRRSGSSGASSADNSNKTSIDGSASGRLGGDRGDVDGGGKGGNRDRISSVSSRGSGGIRHATALGSYTAEAELSLRGSQRLGAQLERDAGMLRSKVFPALLENARQLHALYVAIDRVAEEVMPEVSRRRAVCSLTRPFFPAWRSSVCTFGSLEVLPFSERATRLRPMGGEEEMGVGKRSRWETAVVLTKRFR